MSTGLFKVDSVEHFRHNLSASWKKLSNCFALSFQTLAQDSNAFQTCHSAYATLILC